MDFPDSCSIESITSSDGFDSTYGTPSPSECYYDCVSELDDEGSNLIVSAWLALPPGTTIYPNSRITLSDGTTPPIKKITEVRRLSDNDVEYIRVILGIKNERGGV